MLTPNIFDFSHFSNTYSLPHIPKGFNAISIRLDARLESSLDWSHQIELAKQAVDLGLLILWDLDFGLFSDDSFSLEHPAQFLSFSLALDHFLKTIWEPFQESTLGLIFYRGEIQKIQQFKWTTKQRESFMEWLSRYFSSPAQIGQFVNNPLFSFENCDPVLFSSTTRGRELLTLFARDTLMDYLLLLSEALPASLERYLFLDVESISDAPLFQQVFIDFAEYAPFKLGIKGSDFQNGNLSWESSFSVEGNMTRFIPLTDQKKINVGICLPTNLHYVKFNFTSLEEEFVRLMERKIPFRIVHEHSIINEWDGLDYLLYFSDHLERETLRKLQGFAAAGGELIGIGAKVDSCSTLSLTEFQQLNWESSDE